MPKIAIVTDTNASLPAELVQKFQIIEVPIKIQFGEETYTTGLDIDDEKLFSLIDQRQVLPTTAAPSPDAFIKAYQRGFDEGAEKVICICCSSEVSATFNAAEMAKESFPAGDVHVVDSRQLSLAEGFQVLAAAEAAAEGGTVQEILGIVADIQSRLHVYAALPTLKYLALGGRMGRLAAGFGETLEIKPILTSRGGKLELLEKVRTWKKAKQRLIELAIASATDGTIERIGLIHVNNEEGAQALYGSLSEVLPLPDSPILAEFTPGLSVHTGSGVIAFVFLMAK